MAVIGPDGARPPVWASVPRSVRPDEDTHGTGTAADAVAVWNFPLLFFFSTVRGERAHSDAHLDFPPFAAPDDATPLASGTVFFLSRRAARKNHGGASREPRAAGERNCYSQCSANVQCSGRILLSPAIHAAFLLVREL